MKIAISVQDDVFRKIEAFAKAHRFSRSEVFGMAVRDFLEKAKSRELLEAINEAYSDAEPVEDAGVRQAGKRRYVAKVLKERY